MRPAAVAVAAALLVGGCLALFALAKKHSLGAFARSPQVLEVPLGQSRIAAGGRALVRTEAVTHAASRLGISCTAESETLDLKIGDRSQVVCGVDITFLTMAGIEGSEDDPLRAILEAAWTE